jgi:DNA-binding SARP family transcriptional activator
MRPYFMVGVPQVLHIALMGQFQLHWGDTPVHHLNTPSHQALFAYLVLHADQLHTRQHLAFTFWPDSSEGQARTNLRKAFHQLRQTVPALDTFLEVDRHTVTWRQSAPYTLDVARFETAVKEAETAANPMAHRCCLETAINQYHGELLPGHYEQWVLVCRERLRQHYLACLTQQIRLLEAARDYAAAAVYARRLLQVDPLHEETYRRLMRLQALNNDRAEALRVYAQCAANLRRELQILPSAPTQVAYRRLLTMDGPADEPAETRLPLIGRMGAWTKLRKSWQRVEKEHRLFVLIRGEAGSGKTRLAEELLEWAARQGIPTLRAAGHAPSHSLPYEPIAGWLRHAAVYQPLNCLADIWLREISRLLPELLTERLDLAPSEPVQEKWQQQRFSMALAQPILRLPQPPLLFIDDLHWCQPDLLEWLCFLLHYEPQARFMLVATIRDEEMAANLLLNRLCNDSRHDGRLVDIALGRLNQSATAELARQIVGEELTEAQQVRLYAETEGVPLFVVEMAVKIALGVTLAAGDGAGEGLELLPERVQTLLAERLATLSPAAQEVAGLAAVIGRTFGFELLVAASGEPETKLVQALDELCRQHILREQGTDTFTFSHNRLHRAVYAGLSQLKQRLLREKINAILARQHAPATLTF